MANAPCFTQAAGPLRNGPAPVDSKAAFHWLAVDRTPQPFEIDSLTMRQIALRSCAPLILALSLVVGPAVAAESTPRPIAHEDVWLMKRPGAVAVSPDGRWIVATIAEPAYDEEQKRSDLWIVPSDGSAAPRRLTAGKGSEGSPAFSTDSTRLAFSAKREGDDAAQVYVLELAGGEDSGSRTG